MTGHKGDQDGTGHPGAAASGTVFTPRRRRRMGIWALFAIPLAGTSLIAAFFVVTHRPIPVPSWVLEQVETRVNTMLSGQLRVAVTGGAELIIDDGFVPRVRARNVRLVRPSGVPLAILPELRVGFWPEPLLRGQAVARSFEIIGGAVSLHRLADGRIDLDLGGAGTLEAIDWRDIGATITQIEATFETPVLRALEQVTAENVRLRLDDSRLDRVWEVSDGDLTLRQTGDDISLTLDFGVGEQDRQPAEITLYAATSKRGPEAEMRVSVTDVPARDLAVQSPAVALLGLLDAPISGWFRSAIDSTGALGRTEAELSVGAGAISPVEGAPPIPFSGGSMRLSYDAQAARVTLNDASFTSKALRFRASGQTYLRDFDAGLPREALVQIAMTDIEADPEGIFESPARFSFGAVDARMRLDPFSVDIGQLRLIEDDRRISAKGRISAASDGWRVALDAGVDQIAQHDLLALWPPRLVPPTRAWLGQNVSTGELRNAHAAVRIEPGQDPRLELGYEFRGAEVTILPTLPPVREGRGFASIHDNSHTLMVEEGTIDAPSGGQVEVADSVMRVPDIREKPALAEVSLVTRAPIPAALALLDEPPFRFLSKAGKGTNLAEGWAEARTNLSFRLVKKVLVEDVDFDVMARLTDVRSDKVVPGRQIAAEQLTLRADRQGMTISGRGTFDKVPFDARWSQLFGPANRDHSSLDGYVNVTPQALDAIGVSLPKGMIGGSGWGRLSLDLRKDSGDTYDFETDLRGISLSIPDVGWSKAAAPQGKLALSGKLGKPATIEKITLSAPGLNAEGHIGLNATGLARAVFDKVAIGDWFTGAVDLIGKGRGASPDVAIRRGTLDLRSAPFGKSDGGSGGGTAGSGATRIETALDRLIVSDGLALTGLRGTFLARNGLAGDFAARVNGHAQIEGLIGPSAGGRTAIQIRSPDAGAVLASAGITDRAASGDMVLNLSPIARESYDGTVHVDGLRVTDAPVLASMLSAASIVGLVEQLNGEGIVFSNVDVAFRLTPNGVSITRGEATGVSMGVTMTGNFFPKTGQIDMEGVVSPLYLLNSIGQVISRSGEGLFGFTYRVEGDAKQPRVTVNPLSILTPGALRDLFRRTPPMVRTE